MTVAKAIKILDWWINHKKQAIEQLKEEWYSKDYDKSSEVSKILLDSEKTAISNLETIKAQLVPNCSHPKKMIDTLQDGQKYCMNCNMDL